jgi:hypothetical protein
MMDLGRFGMIHLFIDVFIYVLIYIFTNCFLLSGIIMDLKINRDLMGNMG